MTAYESCTRQNQMKHQTPLGAEPKVYDDDDDDDGY